MNMVVDLISQFGSYFWQVFTFWACWQFSIINPWWGDERVVSSTILAEVGVSAEESGLKPGDDVNLYLHYGVDGDQVIQKQSDHVDTYRVAKAFYEATYEGE
jgi:hypothetical protein